MDISIIIPTKDRLAIFDETFRSVVAAHGSVDAEIIIVNDSKTSVPFVPSDAANIRIVNNPLSGVASARNLGASLAKGQLLIFMDDDFIIPGDGLKQAWKDSQSDPKKIHLYNWVYPPELRDSLKYIQFGRYLEHYGFTSVKGWLGAEWDEAADIFRLKDGASYFLPINKSLFNEIGGYDESFPHAGAEDYDFIQRAKKSGIQFYLDKTLTLYHNERDKLDYDTWMNRKRRNGETIRVAVDLGYTELAFRYSGFKKVLLSALSRTKFLLLALRKSIPNVRSADFFYFRVTNALLAVYLFEGYTHTSKK